MYRDTTVLLNGIATRTLCIRQFTNQTADPEGATGFNVQLEKFIHMVVCSRNVLVQTLGGKHVSPNPTSNINVFQI